MAKVTTLFEDVSKTSALYPRTKTSAISNSSGKSLDTIIEELSQGGGGGADLNSVYPVGSIYISTVSTNPATLFGIGTWERIKDTFLLAAGDTYSAGSTGGAATVTLDTNTIPSHRHSVGVGTGSSTPGGDFNCAWGGSSTWSSYTGGGQAHNNMPPYLTVYVWKRTA